MYLNNRTAAMLVYPTNPPDIELYCHANASFCFGGKTKLLYDFGLEKINTKEEVEFHTKGNLRD